jgi:uncharacterized protein DUF4338
MPPRPKETESGIPSDEVRNLRTRILRSLRAQGFPVVQGALKLQAEPFTKDQIRALHVLSVKHRRDRGRKALEREESWLIQFLAHGSDVVPEEISPVVLEVLSETEELLFRYACLHWSIPVSGGYGRRLRYLIMDEANGKLIGLIGLADPVIALTPRDNWVGWDRDQRLSRLQNVMDAFVLGAVPPYSFMLCGKLVAMLAGSTEVRERFVDKYGGVPSRIRQEPLDGRLALITTTSALGRSSLYNRLSIHGRKLYQSVGYTKGFGEFHFSNGVYKALAEFVTSYSHPTYRHKRWGQGFRNRKEVVKKGLSLLGMSSSLLRHGIPREVFVLPLASNTREFLRGEAASPEWFDASATDIGLFFRERWLLKRVERDQRYKLWSPQEWLLWNSARLSR